MTPERLLELMIEDEGFRSDLLYVLHNVLRLPDHKLAEGWVGAQAVSVRDAHCEWDAEAKEWREREEANSAPAE